MPAIAMSPTLSPKEVFEHYGLKPNHLAQLRYQKKGPRYIQATPRTGPIGTFVVLITVARPCGSRRVGLSFLSRGK